MNLPVKTYTKEVAFLNKKLISFTINWEERTAVKQLMSQPLIPQEADSVIAEYKNVLGKKASLLFEKMFFTVPVRAGGMRVVVKVDLLREKFADEIDGRSGGGGKKYSPLRTDQLKPMGGMR